MGRDRDTGSGYSLSYVVKQATLLIWVSVSSPIISVILAQEHEFKEPNPMTGTEAALQMWQSLFCTSHPFSPASLLRLSAVFYPSPAHSANSVITTS